MVYPLSTDCFWNIEENPLRLGTLLILRRELEWIAQFTKQDTAHIYFSQPTSQYPFIREALTSSLKIFFSHALPPEATWPPRAFANFPLESFSRIHFLA